MTTSLRTTLVIPALVLALFGGCLQRDAIAAALQTGDTPDNVAMKTPPIHLRQTGVTMKNGHPYVETSYQQVLFNCQELAGSISVSPIASHRIVSTSSGARIIKSGSRASAPRFNPNPGALPRVTA